MNMYSALAKLVPFLFRLLYKLKSRWAGCEAAYVVSVSSG